MTACNYAIEIAGTSEWLRRPCQVLRAMEHLVYERHGRSLRMYTTCLVRGVQRLSHMTSMPRHAPALAEGRPKAHEECTYTHGTTGLLSALLFHEPSEWVAENTGACARRRAAQAKLEEFKNFVRTKQEHLANRTASMKRVKPCRQCKRTGEVEAIRSVQLRGSDEGQTTVYKCFGCNATWTEG